jgi:hypothetical protein
MAQVQLTRVLQGASVSTLFAALATLAFNAPPVFAASSNGGQPLILDTQSGISDGHSGTVLQTAPLSHERIVQAKQMATPTELTPNSSTPIIVEPYVQMPGGSNGSTSTSHTRPQPRNTQSTQ